MVSCRPVLRLVLYFCGTNENGNRIDEHNITPTMSIA